MIPGQIILVKQVNILVYSISSKFNLSIKEMNLLTDPVYSKINLLDLSLLYLLILKARNRLLIVITTTNIFVVLYIIINISN